MRSSAAIRLSDRIKVTSMSVSTLSKYPNDRCGDYPVGAGTEAMLAHLRRRLLESGFPHEIGLFLGYPPADVAGFLKNDGKDCKLCGFWKVYDDVDGAVRQFVAFRRCRDALFSRVTGGIPLAQVFPSA